MGIRLYPELISIKHKITENKVIRGYMIAKRIVLKTALIESVLSGNSQRFSKLDQGNFVFYYQRYVQGVSGSVVFSFWGWLRFSFSVANSR